MYSGASNRGVGEVVPPPLNFGGGIEYLSTLPDFEKICFLIAHICYDVHCTGYLYRGGGGGLALLKLI